MTNNQLTEITLSELEKMGCLFKDGIWVNLKDQSPSGEVKIIQLQDIGEWQFLNRSQRFLTQEKANKLKCIFVKKGDILIARLPAPVGRACLFPLENGKYVTIDDVTVFRNTLPNVDPKYLCYCINSPLIRAKIKTSHTGGSRGRISKRKLGEIKLPLRPISIQRKITKKVEKLFLNIDGLNKKFDEINYNIELYLESLLNTAVRGALVPQNPLDEPASISLSKLLRHKEIVIKDNHLKKEKLLPIPNVLPFKLPLGWEWIRVGHIVLPGDYKNLNKDLSKDTRILGMDYIREQELEMSIFEPNLTHLNNPLSPLLYPGDLLFYCDNCSGSPKRCVVFKEPYAASFNTSVMRLRVPLEFVEPQFIALTINTALNQKWVTRSNQSAVRITKNNLHQLLIPLPPRAEQTRIIQTLRKYFAVLKVYKTIHGQQIESFLLLKKSILKEFFDGGAL